MAMLHLALVGLLAVTSTPATQPGDPRSGATAFQPGVWLDWPARTVLVDTRVILREGNLEFLACFAGKEHESILRFRPPAGHIYQALGLLGFEPGHPPVYDVQKRTYGNPAGDLLEIVAHWPVDGVWRTVDATSWLRETEYGRVPLARPWVFAGSQRLADSTLSSDRTGVGIALVDFPDSLVAYSRRYPSDYSALWAEPNTPAIPELGTDVVLALRPAAPRRLALTLDHCGVLRANGAFCTAADLADLLRLARQLEPERTWTIRWDRTLAADRAAVQRALVAGGVPADAVAFVAGVRPGDDSRSRRRPS
jgi:hypothetical protein